ncbi:MAG: IPT/TIG domain-containing protein [Nitrospirota bacterium]|nr:IPT/TIG domain-containing protein [Nitrospirota bacterium]
MRRWLPLLTMLAMGLVLTAPAFAQTVLFGPKPYTRTAGPPNQFADTFTLPTGTTAPYTLHVVNGHANGTNRISSATVKLNGTHILGPGDFGQNVAILDRTVALQANNTLEIRLTSAPGSFLVVSVLDTGAGAQPTALAPNPLNLVAGATGTLTATLAPAPTAAGSLAVSSANSAVVTVPASVAFAAGQTSVPIAITAVASGSTTVTVTLNGASVASQVDVALPAPTVTGFTPTSGQPGTSVTITGTNFVNVQTVTFHGILAPTFTVTNSTTLVAVVPPTATTGPIAVMTLAGTGTSASSFTVIPAPTVASLQPATLSIVRGTTGTLTVTLNAVQTTATSVTVSSSNPTVAAVPGSVTVPANQLSAPVTVTALIQGQADITASLNGTSASSTITVVNPVPSITALSPASLPSGSPNTTLTVIGQSFVTGATVTFGNTALVTTFVNATSLTATIPAALLTAKGTVPVTVENPAPGGGASNSLPFTIVNGTPVLAPIGNKTIPLGSTLTFTATATDPDNDPVTFAVTPLPLPAHATFNAQTGQFIFTPDATQVGSFPLTIIAGDGILTVSETITVTVTGAPVGGITGVSGRVVDGSGLPIANLPVSLKGTLATTTTNAQGQFTLNNLAVTGRQVLLADGFAQGYAILASPVDLIPNVVNQLPSELRVPALDMASAVTVNPNATTVLGNPSFPAVSVTIPPHTAKNANGTDYTGVLTISPVPEYGRPESRPVELRPGFSITIQPAGITFTTPAPITLPNTDNLPVGNEFDLWSLSPDTGTFYVAGRMKVSADGSRLETLSGGVRKTAWHFALAPAASIPNEQNRIIGGCTKCAMASDGDLTEGTLTQNVTIPGIRTLGASRDLTLHYNSTTADVRPILPVTATLDIRAAVPHTFSAQITVGGLQQGTRGYWDASPMNEQASSTTRLGVQYDAAPLPTGRYPYELLTFSNYGQSSIGAISRGFTMTRNEQQSPFGAGWTLMGLDKIVVSSGTALLARGDGRTIP